MTVCDHDLIQCESIAYDLCVDALGQTEAMSRGASIDWRTQDLDSGEQAPKQPVPTAIGG